MTTIVTNCSRRKRLPPESDLVLDSLEDGPLDEIVARWSDRVKTAETTIQADGLYCGRAFGEARDAAEMLEARLLIVSAGLGVVSSDQQVPAYDLTIAPGAASNVLSRVHGDATSTRAA